MPTTRLRRLTGCLLALMLCLSCGCSGTDEEAARQRPLRVGWFLWSGWYPMAIAKENGLFAKRGLNIEAALYESYTVMMADFASGKLDAVFGGLYELLKANVPGMRIVLATDCSDGAEGLVVTSDIKTPADLKGKRIGMQGSLSGSEFLLTTLLRRHGLSEKDLTLVDVEPEAVLAAMPQAIQGGYTWEPFLSKARERGCHVLFTTADVPGMIPDVAAFQGSVATKRPSEVQAFVDAWFEAVDFWTRSPRQGDERIAKSLGLSPGEISLAGCRLYNREDNVAAFSDNDDPRSLFATGRKQIAFFVSVGDASTVPDLRKTLDASFVSRAPK